MDTHIITINGMVIEGQLKFNIATKLGEKETIAFANNFQQQIEQITTHCEEVIERHETCYTPSDFETVELSQNLLDNIQKDKGNLVEAIYPANSLQQGFIYHTLSQPEDDAYRVQLVFDYKQAINVENYRKAWELAIQKYPILRTAFNWQEEVIQIIYTTAQLNYQFLDISDLSNDKKKEAYIDKLQREDRKIPFDLTKPCLLRLYVIKQAANHYTVLKSEHHSISDGWSGPVLLDTIHKSYQELQQNKTVKINTDNAYPEAQQYFAQQKHSIEQYQQEKIATIKQTNDLSPFLLKKQDLDKVKSIASPTDTHIEITGELYQHLKSSTKKEGFTLNTLVQFAWHKLIQIYTQDTQTIVGTSISGRDIPIPGIEESVGLYINTLPLIIDWDNKNTVLQQIQYIQRQTVELNTHSFAHLANLQQEGKRLFHSLLVFENYPIPENSGMASKDKLIPTFRYAVEKLDYPLGIAAYEQADKLVISLKSDRKILSEEKAHHILSKVKHLISETLINSEKPHHTLSTLTQAERQQVITGWNQTDKPFPDDKPLYRLFEGQAAKTPDQDAIVFEGEKLTYSELNQRSNQLARYLQTQTAIKADTLVALYLDRSPEMVISILAILKAGGAYVPIDTQYPKDRVDYILQDTKAKLVLTQSRLTEKLQGTPPAKLVELDSGCYQTQEMGNLSTQGKPTDLAYVIYTSGTTGKPKGTCLTHKSLNNLSKNIASAFGINTKSVLSQFISSAFDASIAEIFPAIISGATLCIIPESTKLNGAINQYINKHVITHFTIPASFLESMEPFEAPSLKVIHVGGGVCPAKTLDKWSNIAKVINAYGPTESAVCATLHAYKKGGSNVNIGRPLPNIKCYVLGPDNNPVPPGVVGELHIGGAGLARGYLNQPGLTAEKFIENPFASKEDLQKGYDRVYRTGDLVKWASNGSLQYIGRNDSQVKVRGYRIELGEIENALTQIEGVQQACVLAKQKGDGKYLVAYYVPGPETTESAIFEKLGHSLPDYMVPAVLVPLGQFPLTANGKLDKKALPEPKFTNTGTYLPPTTGLEIKLAGIWKEVLGLEKVGVTDDFFRIGGNSILAIKIAHKISKELQANLPVADIFKYKTIKQLAQINPNRGTQPITIKPQKLNKYPLSFAQQRLWFIEQYEQGTNAYHIPMLVQLHKGVGVNKLKRSIQQTVKRHEVLRTTFNQENGEFFQLVNRGGVGIKEFSGSEEDIESQLDADINSPFDLEGKGPIRVCLYHHKERTLLLVNIHHIASDGWSVGIFFDEICQLYLGRPVPPMAVQYKDFAVWQREYLRGETLKAQRDYWAGKLKGYQTLAMPTDRPRPQKIDYAGGNVFFTIDKKLSGRLRQISNKHAHSLYTTLLSGFYILLNKYTSQEDIVVGTPMANRHYPEIQDLIGFFVNSLAIREGINPKEPASQLMAKVHKNLTEAQRFQDLPFEKVVEVLGVGQDPSKHPIFQVMFGLQSFGKQIDQTLFDPVTDNSIYTVSKYDLSCSLDDSGEKIEGALGFATALYQKTTVQKLAKHYVFVLKQMADHPDRPIKEYSLLSRQEYRQVVTGWNQTDKPFPGDKSLHRLFEGQAARTPDQDAIVFEGEKLTYSELNQKANQLARYLQAQTAIKADTLVALYLDRSPEMVISILAILKAGGAYVPIDTQYPEDRVGYILQDTKAKLVLTQSHLTEKLQKITTAKLVELDSGCYQTQEMGNLSTQGKPTDLAYVIYTSGTTGKPKGVMVEHRGVVNLIHNQIDSFNIYGEKVALFANYTFDASVEQVFLSVLSGSCLYIPTINTIKDPSLFERFLMENGITHLHATPSYLNHLTLRKKNASLKRVVSAGEEFIPNLARRYKGLMINKYGATEASISSSQAFIKSSNTKITIGAPMANIKCYVLGPDNNPVPPGVIGELHIGGAGLARGYLNQPGLTAEKFIENPFASKEDLQKGYDRVYRTGDLVKWASDGNLQYIGRNDSQVKVRGYRIELGEIENALTQIEGVQQACVLAKQKGGGKYLVAYYVPGPETTESAIFEKLGHSLPDYMVPAVLVPLGQFPLTANGKLDKKALPEPKFTNTGTYLPPTTGLEIKLAGIWKEVLGLEKVGVTDNFFRIGGNSILAIKIAHKISKELQANLPVADIFKYKTIKQLAQINPNRGTQPITIKPQKLNKYPLSFAQQRLWFIEQYEQGTNAYHIPMLVQLHKGVGVNKLKRSIQQTVKRHEVLRTTFNQENGEFFQLVNRGGVGIKEFSGSEEDIESQLDADINSPFDLEGKGPIRVCLYHHKERTLLLVNIHHIASDGWSVGIFFDEICQLYLGRPVPPMAVQYKDFAVWQREYLRGETLKAQRDYWAGKLKGYQTLAMPTDRPRPQKIDYAGGNVFFTINKKLSGRLRGLSVRHGHSLYTTLLSGFYILLNKYTSQEDIVVGTPMANRHYPEIQDLIGFFVNSLAIREGINPKEPASQLMAKVHKNLTEAQRFQDLPFEKVVEVLGVGQDPSKHPIFQVMFGLQSFGKQIDQTLFDPVTDNSIYTVSKYDLSCSLDDSGEKIEGALGFATALYQKTTVQKLAKHYVFVLKQMADHPDRPIKEYSLLSRQEYRQVVTGWNQTDKPFPGDKSLHRLFEGQAARTPDQDAIVFEGEKLTYSELNQKANQLARYLQAQTAIKADTLVALYLDRSPEMVISILAILKAGGAYVPIDTQYPEDRVGYILQDTKAKLVLTQSHLTEKLQKITTAKLVELDSGCYQTQEMGNLSTQGKPTDLAYVIYTSGTTGKPKGVMVEHRGVVNLIHNQIDSFNIYGEKVALFANYTFDASVEQVFLSVLSGSCLYIPTINTIKDPSLFERFLMENGITHLHATPSYLNHLTLRKKNASLKRVVSAGEEFIPNLARRYKGLMINKYGATEASISSSQAFIKSSNTKIMIGAPMANIKCYVLGPDNNPVPPGVIGELHIGGAGLARGYLNQPGLTAEKFIENPFASKEDLQKGYDRVYRTGDLVKWASDGNLQYIGRNDSQVKVRGYRIELGEIENALTQIEGVQQACVLAKQKGDGKYLVAYYVPGPETTESAIFEKLGHSLPDYMVPAVLVPLGQFPLTANGKLDKDQLPEPDFGDKDTYVPASTAMEVRLAGIWKEVLGLEKVGVTDDFFRIGGNSILAIKIAHKISKELQENLPVADIFKYKTIKQLAQINPNRGTQPITIKPQKLNKYPLSFAQQRLWFIEQYEQGTNAYHIPMLVQLHKGVGVNKLKRSIQQTVKRHQVLTTTFKQENGQFFQIVNQNNVDIKEFFHTKQNIQKQIIQDINSPFDLEGKGPIRVCLYHHKERTLLLVNIHHIAADGWSVGILFNEIHQLYLNKKLHKIPIQYKDFAVWQKKYLKGKTLKTQIDYWNKKLKGYQTLAMPTDRPRPQKIDYAGDNVSFSINKKISDKLRQISNKHAHSLYTTLLSGFYILLNKYTSQEDIVVGTPMANRHYPEIQNLIGFFVNSLAIRENINPKEPASQLMAKVHKNLTEAQRFQDLPFEKVVEVLGVEQDPSKHPIFQVVFGLQSFGQRTDNSLFKPITKHNAYAVSKCDLSCFLDDSGEKIEGTLGFATALYQKTTVQKLAKHYVFVLKQMAEHIDKPIKEYSLLSRQEYRQVVTGWNQTDKPFPGDKSLHRLFEGQAARTPDQDAIVFEGEKLTYSELNQKANQLARYLQAQTAIKADTLVALYLDRSPEMVISILAILKAGGAYVPIDTQYPKDRVGYILQDTKAKLVLTQSHLTEKLQKITTAKPLEVDSNCYQTQEMGNLSTQSKPTDLAYVIYTSGTTGKPKGVMVEHQSVVNLIMARKDSLKMNSNSRYLLFVSICFDPSVFAIFVTLLSNASLYILSLADLQFKKFYAYVKKHQITHTNLPASFLTALPKTESAGNSLQIIGVGAEACDQSTLNHWSKKATIINAYGPTESTVCATTHVYKKEGPNTIIGKPLNNIRCYVLGNDHKPVPPGVIGELHIGGAGLARGYLNQPGLTAEKFIENPFASKEDLQKGYDRIYKTGDLVKWAHDGNLQYIGRNDSQVKIRGYRIELGEIENAFTAINGVKQACVLAKQKEGGKYLVAYYVADPETTESTIFEKLGHSLPDYMVPAVLVPLGQFPLTVNGKLDKKALPEPKFENKNTHVPPSTAMEIKLADIWKEVLSLDKVGVTDNFFRIGGNSVLAIELIYKMNAGVSEKGIHFNVIDLFKHKNIKALIAGISVEKNAKGLIKNLSITDSDQKQLFFVHSGRGGCEVYADLAKKLKDKYNSFGVDNYNILNKENIADLNLLAKEYVDALPNFKLIDKINLCGWSLGGQIALEMAYILEQKGFMNITVYLLDTFIQDEYLIHHANQQYEIEFGQEERVRMLLEGYQEEYAAKIIKASKAEREIVKQPISGVLKSSKVILFKALQENKSTRTNYEGKKNRFQYTQSLKDNNIGQFVENLNVINLPCNHWNILDYLSDNYKYWFDDQEASLEV